MSDIDEVKNAMNEWIEGLENGDVDRMIATIDPEAITCNEHQPTDYGIDATREKYALRIASASFKPGLDIEYIKVYDSFAVVVGFFSVELTDKASGQQGGGKGRLLLVYRKHADGWKMVIDFENNDEKS